MKLLSTPRDPQAYRDRAKRLRDRLGRTHDLSAQYAFHRAAEDYEWLADFWENALTHERSGGLRAAPAALRTTDSTAQGRASASPLAGHSATSAQRHRCLVDPRADELLFFPAPGLNRCEAQESEDGAGCG